MQCALLLFTLLLPFLQHSRAQCVLPNSEPHREIRDVLVKVILHQDFRRCSSLDTTYERLVCEIWDEADQTSLRDMTCSTGDSSRIYHVSNQRSPRPCPDGSFNKTCLPHDHGEAYACACHSVKQPDPCPNIYQWDSRWRK